MIAEAGYNIDTLIIPHTSPEVTTTCRLVQEPWERDSGLSYHNPTSSEKIPRYLLHMVQGLNLIS